jgi:hypothetical protein
MTDSTSATYQHASAVCGLVTTGLRDLTGFDNAEYPGVDKALPGGTFSVEFSGGRYAGVNATLAPRSCRHFPHEDFDMEVDAWSHVADCLHDAILNALPIAAYPNGTVHMTYDKGRMHPALL